MLKRILVFLLVYAMAFYPIFGSLANAGSNKPQVRSLPLQVVSRGQESGVEKQTAVDESTKVRLQENYGKLPLSFIQNNGQVDEKVKFYEKGSGHATFFTQEGIYLSLVRSQKPEGTVTDLRTERSGVVESGPSPATKSGIATPPSVARNANPQSEIVKLTPIGANKNPKIIAEDKQEGKVNYFIGNDPEKWKTNIPTYKAVVYKDIYKNIDMKFYGNNNQLEYDIIVKPGADPNMVKLSYEGIDGLKVTDNGDLLINLKEESIIQKKPYIYQEIDGKRVEVDGRFVIQDVISSDQRERGNLKDEIASALPRKDKNEGVRNDIAPQLATRNSQHLYGIQVASYDKNHPLIIDPVLVYSTYFGGSQNDGGRGLAIDTSGNVYVAGLTWSTNFPTVNPIQGNNTGDADIFVTKINAAGNSIVYSTYLGGSYNDDSGGIAVDMGGNAYITGRTSSANFPVVSPIQTCTSADVFITKVDTSGSNLVYSTCLGGNDDDYGKNIVVDTSGNAYITGHTTSTNFPLTSPIQGSNAGSSDVFVAKINSPGNAIVYSTYLGGSGNDQGFDIAVDISRNVYVIGLTKSTNFPLLSPLQGTYAGNDDVFVAKIVAAGDSLIYSTYLGGSDWDWGYGIAVDISGNAYITGETKSVNFPTISPIQSNLAGGYDAFVAKINSSGNVLTYSTYLGGSSTDQGFDIAVDTSGNAYVVGRTLSTDFPILSPIDGTCESCPYNFDIFVARINTLGSNLVYSTYLGGDSDEYWANIVVDAYGSAYITGNTNSINFPIVSPIQSNLASGPDAFVTKIATNISGCIQLNGSAVVGSSVTLKQKRETDQVTNTDTTGCYGFEKAVSGKSFQVIINGPVIP